MVLCCCCSLWMNISLRLFMTHACLILIFGICDCICSCQFVVKATGDYTVQSIDPDKLVDWELIEQVVSYQGKLMISFFKSALDPLYANGTVSFVIKSMSQTNSAYSN